MKRAFHSSLRVTRCDFKELGLTPARMDVLVALDRARKPLWQSHLRRILGYSARSTLAQMLRALDVLGWTRRKRSERDARQRDVELTRAGREQLARAEYHFFPGWAFEAPLWAKDWGSPFPAETQAWDAYLEKTVDLDAILSNFRFALRDTASLCYPWPED